MLIGAKRAGARGEIRLRLRGGILPIPDWEDSPRTSVRNEERATRQLRTRTAELAVAHTEPNIRSFPFHPVAHVRGIFGDPQARLRHRQRLSASIPHKTG